MSPGFVVSLPPEILALAAACFYASSHMAIKFATQDGPLLFGLLITQATGAVALLGLAVSIVETWEVSLLTAVVFALAGVVGPGLGRALGMRSVRDAGTTVTVPVQASTTPILSTVAGVVLFGEFVGLGRIVALGLIVVGIWFSVRGGSANRAGPVVSRQAGQARWLVLLAPLGSGAAYAGADTLRKLALETHGDAVLGALIGIVAAFAVWLLVFLVRAVRHQGTHVPRGWGWFCVSGLLSAAAQVSLMSALAVGDLSTVAPITASQPVIVIVLSSILLRRIEGLRPGTVAGAFVAFAGIAYLSVAQ